MRDLNLAEISAVSGGSGNPDETVEHNVPITSDDGTVRYGTRVTLRQDTGGGGGGAAGFGFSAYTGGGDVGSSYGIGAPDVMLVHGVHIPDDQRGEYAPLAPDVIIREIDGDNHAFCFDEDKEAIVQSLGWTASGLAAGGFIPGPAGWFFTGYAALVGVGAILYDQVTDDYQLCDVHT